MTPDHLHFQPTMDALEKGKHVICEKPLAVNREDAKEMLDAAERAGVKHLCCFNYRFFPIVRLAYELIHSGELEKFTTSQAIIIRIMAALKIPCGGYMV